MTTYKLTIHFSTKPSWSKSGYTWLQAIELKEWFMSHVPSAVSGVMEPEKKRI